MARFKFHVEVDCGLDVEIEAPDYATAKTGAELALMEHVADGCEGVEADEADEFDFEPETIYGYRGQPGDLLMSWGRDEDTAELSAFVMNGNKEP